MMTHLRGSRKHILDLLDRPDYTFALNAILADKNVELQATEPRQPHGHADPKEWTLRHFVREHLGGSGFDYSKFCSWWVPEHFTNRTWDLLSTCTIAGRRGLLLVEAKANVSEVGFNGKLLHQEASDQSRSNHRQIIASLHEAQENLNQQIPGFSLCQSHYQLCNRIASAWKLAACGLPVVLLYLGFTGDTGITDAGMPFADDAHWQATMKKYMAGVVPYSLLGKTLTFDTGTIDKGTMTFLVRSTPALSVSVPAMRCMSPRFHDWRTDARREIA